MTRGSTSPDETPDGVPAERPTDTTNGHGATAADAYAASNVAATDETRAAGVAVQGAAGDSGRDGASAASQPHRSTGRRALGWTFEIAIVVIGALVISAVLRAFVAQMFIIPSGSMENTLQVNDRVMVSKVSDFHRGDVVVFTDPGGWLTGSGENTGSTRTGVKKVLEQVGLLPSTSNDHLIKRVIGLPGDEVKCCDAQWHIMVNGVSLDESSYIYNSSGSTKAASVAFDVIVPAGHIWVMGDHRDDSWDSRCHLQDVTQAGGPTGSNAFVPESDVVGPAIAVLAPLDRIKHLTAPSVFASVPAASGTPPSTAVIKQGTGCTS